MTNRIKPIDYCDTLDRIWFTFGWTSLSSIDTEPLQLKPEEMHDTNTKKKSIFVLSRTRSDTTCRWTSVSSRSPAPKTNRARAASGGWIRPSRASWTTRCSKRRGSDWDWPKRPARGIGRPPNVRPCPIGGRRPKTTSGKSIERQFLSIWLYTIVLWRWFSFHFRLEIKKKKKMISASYVVHETNNRDWSSEIFFTRDVEIGLARFKWELDLTSAKTNF